MYAIEECLKEHLDELIELNIEVQRIHAEKHPELFKSDISKVSLAKFYAELLQDEEQHILVALDGQNVVGYIWAEQVCRKESLFTHSFRRMKINHISISEQHKGAGIGSSFIKSIEKIAKQKGMPEIALDVWQFNGNAINFFEKQGFKAFNINMWKHC